MGRKMKLPPVYFTIGQVQHNPLLNLSAYLPTIQEAFRKVGYPDFRKLVQVQFALDAAPVGEAGGQTRTPVPQTVERYIFLNAECTRSVLLQQNSLSFQTTSYETFDVFLSELRAGVQVFSEIVGGLGYTDRLGLRYLDAVVPTEGSNLNQYLVPEVMGLHSRMTEETFSYSFAESVLVSKGVGQIVSRTFIQNGPIGFPPDLQPHQMKIGARFEAIQGAHAIVDTDGSASERMSFDLGAISRRLTELHSLIDKCFHATVTDHARAEWLG